MIALTYLLQRVGGEVVGGVAMAPNPDTQRYLEKTNYVTTTELEWATAMGFVTPEPEKTKKSLVKRKPRAAATPSE